MDRIHPDTFDRIGKALVDRLEVSPDVARQRLEQVQLEIAIDNELASSATLQAALLTLVNLTPRIFKRPAVIVDPNGALAARPLVPYPGLSLQTAVDALGGRPSLKSPSTNRVVIGGGNGPGLRVSFDGWSTRVGPAAWSKPLSHREHCVLAGIAGAGIALSEVFLESFGFDIEAGKREVGLSLWAPDESVTQTTAPGPVVEYLPGEAWMLGLGHLGQGMIWALSMLPYATPSEMALLLQDFDRVKEANLATQAVTLKHHIGCRKTHVCSGFLRRFGFDPGIIDRPFDGRCQRLDGEPALAFSGFDGTGPRDVLDAVRFERVVVCGVGGTVDDFDDIQMHTIPLQGRTAKELWLPRPQNNNPIRLAEANPFYRKYREHHNCGELELAGIAVAVPFVGAITGALAWAEVLRELHGAPRGAFIGLPVRCVEERRVRYARPDELRARYAKPHLPTTSSTPTGDR